MTSLGREVSERALRIAKAAGVISTLAALVFLLLYPQVFGSAYSFYKTRKLIRSAQAQARSTQGRLTSAPYSAQSVRRAVPEDYGRAQLIVLGMTPSPQRDYLQSLIDIGNGNWRSAGELLARLNELPDADAAAANDLGVVFLELVDDDTIYLFKALEQFEAAERLSPNAPEPRFNALLVARRLQLAQREEDKTSAYTKLEGAGPWHDELLRQGVMEEERVGSELQAALDRKDDAAAQSIFTRSPELCRKIAMQYGMNPRESGESQALAQFVAQTIKRRYGDETVTVMLEALSQPNSAELIEARGLVKEGAAYYMEAQLERSLESYGKALALLKTGDSVFDRVWINVNLSDTELRLGRSEDAKHRLEGAIAESKEKNLKWIQATAIAPYGAFRSLNASFSEMMGRLEESVRLFGEIGAPRESIRIRYYIMGYRYFAGDLDSALRMVVEGLGLADPSNNQNHVRLTTLQNFLSVILHKKGFVEQSVMIGDESVFQAVASNNLPLVGATTSALALIEEANGQQPEADRYMARSEKATREIPDSTEQERSDAILNNAKARIYLSRGKTGEAEDALSQSRTFFDTQQRPSILHMVETSMLLGQTYASVNKPEEARQAFRRAIDISEESNTLGHAERVLAFDDGRRELFDSAVDFEYSQGDTDTAWTYVQKYRAKLFVEILAQLNPAVEKAHAIALNRNEVQKAIPSGIQIVEYALLPERLLIWVTTNNSFKTRSVTLKRADIERQVQAFLADLRSKQPTSQAAVALYKTLITPIEDLLDPNRALAIIPDGALHGLPFAALICPESGYLINKYAVVVSPTLSHFLAVDKGPGQRDSIVTFGARTGDVADTREIGAMEGLYRNVASYRGTQVTKASFLSEMSKASIFHYAGHSAHDASDPLRSSILLDGDKPGPNSVTAVDISMQKLQPNALVVLSSCDSSVGNSKDGIGIRGLTSAFLISGAASVVGSLWPVDAPSTTELMIAFHRAFASEKLPIAQALRKAQLAFLTANPKRAHPYYWSGFVVTGNYSALR